MSVSTAFNGGEEDGMVSTGLNGHQRTEDPGLATGMSDHKMDGVISKANTLLFEQRNWLANLHVEQRSPPKELRRGTTSANSILGAIDDTELPLFADALKIASSSIPTKSSLRYESPWLPSVVAASPTSQLVSISTTSSTTSSQSATTSFFYESAIEVIPSSTIEATTHNLSSESPITFVPRAIPLISPTLISGSSVIFLITSSSRTSISQVASKSSVTPFLDAAQQSASSALSSASAALASAQSSATAAVMSANQQLNDAKVSASSALREAQSSATGINAQATSIPKTVMKTTTSPRTLALALTFSILGSVLLSILAFFLFLRYRRQQREQRMGFRTSKFKDSQEKMFCQGLDDPVGDFESSGYPRDRAFTGGGRFAENTPIRSLEPFQQENYASPKSPIILPPLSQIPEDSILGNILPRESLDNPPRQSIDKRVLITQVPTSKFSTNLVPRPLTAATASSRMVTLTYDPDHPRAPPSFTGVKGLQPIVTEYSPTRGPFTQNGFSVKEPSMVETVGGGGPAQLTSPLGGKIISPQELRERFMNKQVANSQYIASRYTEVPEIPTRYTNSRYSNERLPDNRYTASKYSGFDPPDSNYTASRYLASRYWSDDGNGMMFRASELMRGPSGAGYGGPFGGDRVRSQRGEVMGRRSEDWGDGGRGERRSSIWGLSASRISKARVARVGKRYRGRSIGTTF